ncbi:unnamed protein product [Mucor hiemalis]
MSEHISFEHFDPELELGNLDENGRPIRPRKKPGRKPNPPSPAQRKAQNRAAQRAFRERKRREMREAESTVKRCLYARDQAIRESRRLQRRVDELVYETNYLKGYALTLKMACIANEVEVPKFWDTGVTDEIGSDELTFSKTKGVPQQLEFFLDKNMNIICIDGQHVLSKKGDKESTMSDNELPPSSILSCSSPSSSHYNGNNSDSNNVGSPLSSSSESSYISDEFDNHSSSNGTQNDFVMNNALSSIAPQLASHLETPFFQQLLNTDLVGRNHLNDMNMDELNEQQPPPPMEEEEVYIDAKTGLPRTTTEFHPHYATSHDDNSSTSTRSSHFSSQSSMDKKNFPPMTPLDAIKQMRAVKNLESSARALFIPTELQRTIRHDTRIDVVPGAALRDHMILFQDFYDANELFRYLQESSVFLGGELGNPDSWFVPPNFFKRYWFLCPNHKRHRLDNAVEALVNLGKHMMQLMAQRKQMYIERENYPEFFPEPTAVAATPTPTEFDQVVQQAVDEEFLQRDDHQHLNDIYHQQPMDNLFSMEDDDDKDNMDLLSSDMPLDHFMTMMNATYA